LSLITIVNVSQKGNWKPMKEILSNSNIFRVLKCI